MIISCSSWFFLGRFKFWPIEKRDPSTNHTNSPFSLTHSTLCIPHSHALLFSAPTHLSLSFFFCMPLSFTPHSPFLLNQLTFPAVFLPHSLRCLLPQSITVIVLTQIIQTPLSYHNHSPCSPNLFKPTLAYPIYSHSTHPPRFLSPHSLSPHWSLNPLSLSLTLFLSLLHSK